MTRPLAGIVGILLVLPLIAWPSQAPAQQVRRPAQQQPAKPAEPPPPPPEPPPPPYERELLRFSEVIGSLSFLRGLCGAADAGEWQKRMQTLLEAEGTTQGRRERLAGAYNRGYRGYALTYRTCTTSAGEATARFLAEGDRLSRSLASRYGG
ncbi:MAG TPA: TIGR02301 family protein [Beijerinckiaceae bacterium]|jgi:uncharacterized protein (TIGR02301 family)